MEKKSTATHVIYIIIIVILLLVIAGGYWYFQKNQQTAMMGTPRNATTGQNNQIPPKKDKGGMDIAMMMTPVTPPPISDQQQEQLTAGLSKATTVKTFNITAGNFYFIPNKITVNKGDKVTFVVTNAGGFHDLVIDELGVKTAMLKTGEAATDTFTASKKGSFAFYCSIKGHKQRGMFGTLTVQ